MKITKPSSPTHRKRASFLTLVMLIGQFAPYGAFAVPQPISRDGAGISRLPLDVLAFNAPSFGMVSDAINLASGNVFVDGMAATHNNILTQKDDKQNLFADWNLAPKLRLEGFSRAWPIAPDGLSIASGDSSRLSYLKVEPTQIDFAHVPTWIARYQNVQGVTFYRSRAEIASQSSESWVILTKDSDGYIAHLYQTDGTRATFARDGEFADYLQTPSQQYRAAKAGDSEGINSTSPKTELSYADTTQGHLSEIKDEYGRTTRLVWDTTTNTLKEVQQLVTNGKGNGINHINFQYQTIGSQQALRQVTFTTQDGFGNEVSRWIKFEYQNSGDRLLVTKLSREALDSSASIDTGYNYDTQNRLISVTETGQPVTKYDYVASDNGQIVTVTQGDKADTYQFNRYSQLEHRIQRDFNPIGGEKKLSWDYTYDNAGRTASVKEPTGLTTIMSYDNHGNLTQVDEFNQGAEVPATPAPSDPNNPVPQAVSNPPTNPPTNPKVNFTIALQSKPATLSTGQICQFSATLIPTAGSSLPADSSLVWSAISGKIDQITGKYTAPDLAWGRPAVVPLTDTVTVKSKSDPSVSDSMTFRIDRLGGNCTTTVAASGIKPTINKLDLSKNSDRSYQYTYDRDNRLIKQITPERTGTKDGTPYKSEEVRIEDIYKDVTTSTQGQTFQIPGSLTRTVYLGGKEQQNTTTTYDEFNRPVDLTRTSGDQNISYHLTYANGTAVSVPYAKDDGTVGAMRPVIQYGDQVAIAKRGDGLTTEFTYDEFGNTVTKNEINAFQGDKGLQNRTTLQVFNGFGDLVLSTVQAEGRNYNTQINHYYATGEIKDTWVGNSDNTTNYLYITSGDGLGKPQTINKGLKGRDSTTYAYDSYGRVSSATRLGSKTTFQYDTLDRVVERIEPDGAKAQYNYDSSGGVSKELLFEPKRQLTKTTNVDYDPQGNPTRIDDGLGVKTLSYDSYGRLIKLLDSHLQMDAEGEDQAQYYAYDGLGNLTAEIGAALSTGGRLGSQKDSRRPMMRYFYNGLGQITKREELIDGHVSASDLYSTPGAQFKSSTITYDSLGHTKQVTYASGMVVNVETDPSGNTIQETKVLSSGNAVQKFAYDALDNTVKNIDALGRVTRASYNELGMQTSVIKPTGDIAVGYTFTPDYLEEGTYRPDPNAKSTAPSFTGASTSGMIAVQKYDYPADSPYPNAINQVSKDSAINVPLTHDSKGRVTTEVLPDGRTDKISYDGWDNVIQSDNASGASINQTYDTYGRLIKRTYTRSNPQDTASDVTTASQTFTYNNAGQMISAARGQMVTQYAYNSLGKTIAETKAIRSGVNPSRIKYYGWRPDGKMIFSTSFGFAGKLPTTEQNPDANTAPSVTDGQISLYNLDAPGHVITNASYGKNGRESITNFEYNGLDLPIHRIFQGDPNVYSIQHGVHGENLGTDLNTSYQYDLSGQLLNVVDADKNGTPISQHDFTYTANGQEASRRNRHSFTGSYNLPNNPITAQGVVLGAQDLIVESQYSAGGQLTGTAIKSQGKTITNSLTYFNDANKKTVKGSSGDLTGRTLTFDYDWSGQLTGSTVTNDATGKQVTGNIAYDNKGSFTESIPGKTKREESYNIMGLPQKVNIYVPGPQGELVLGSEHLFSYNNDGQETKHVITQHYWKVGNADGYKDPTYGDVTMSYERSYDDSGKPVSERVTLPKTFADSIEYCKQNAVKCTTNGDKVTALSGEWSYDKNGEVSHERESAPADFTSNRDVNYQRSAVGMMTSSTGVYADNATYSSQDGAVLRYNPENSLASMDRSYQTGDNRKVSARFGYDPYGQRTFSLNAIQRETNGSSVQYDMDRDIHETAYSGNLVVGTHSATTSQGNTSDWGRTAAQNDQAISREDRWRDLTYGMADGVGDDRFNFNFHFEPRDFTQYPSASEATAVALASGGVQQPGGKTLNTPPDQSTETIVPLGWGVPFQVAHGNVQTQVQATNTLKGQEVASNADASLLEQQLKTLQAPNGGLSNNLGINPENIQKPQPVQMANGGLPSDDLSTGQVSNQDQLTGLHNSLLEVKGPNTATAPVAPQAGEINALPNGGLRPLGTTGLSNPGTGACDPNPSFPCNTPRGGGGPGGPPHNDPIDQNCPCGHDPNYNPFKNPVLQTGAVVAVSAGQVYTETIDGFWNGVGWIGDKINVSIQYYSHVPLGDIDEHMSSRWVDNDLRLGTNVTEITEKNQHLLGYDTYYDKCGAPIKVAKLGWEIATFFLPETRLGRGKTKVPCLNSFTEDTVVWIVSKDSSGKVIETTASIGNIKVGDIVKGYDEISGKEGYYPISALLRHIDEQITHLVIQNQNGDLQFNFITTTPEHPFYLNSIGGDVSYPKPLGHEELSAHWVGAGHLNVGAQIQQQSGESGKVIYVGTVTHPQEMFNLTVDTAHTFYVGTNGWLVHNAGVVPGPGCDIFARTKFRQGAINNAKADAPRNADGNMICPTCGEPIPDKITIQTKNGPVDRRGFDLDHFPDTWAERVQEMQAMPTPPTRADVIREFNRDLRVQCPACNVSHAWEGIPGPFQPFGPPRP